MLMLQIPQRKVEEKFYTYTAGIGEKDHKFVQLVSFLCHINPTKNY